MKIVSIISQKGGAGKTTIAIHLAVAAELAKKQTAIIDLDPQASSTNWADSRKNDTPVVISAQSSRLGSILTTAEQAGAKLCVIDTAPHSESAALASSRVADIILIPCRPAILDIRAIGNSIDLAKISGKKAFVLLNAVPARGSLAEEAKKAIEAYDIETVDVKIGQRSDFIHALTSGRSAQEYDPSGKAAQEITQLYMWLCKKIKL